MYDMLPRRKTDLELMEERLTSHILSVLSEIKGGERVAYTSWDGRIETEGLYMPENNKPRCGDKKCWKIEIGVPGKCCLLEAKELLEAVREALLQNKIQETLPMAMISIGKTLDMINTTLVECCGFKPKETLR